MTDDQLVTQVTPEMQQAYVEWDAPDLPPTAHPAKLLGFARTAFYAGWQARLTHSPASDVGDSELAGIEEKARDVANKTGGYDSWDRAVSAARIGLEEGYAEGLAALTPTTLASADDDLCERTLEEAAKVAEEYPSPMNDLPMALAMRSVATAIRKLKPKPEGEELANNA